MTLTVAGSINKLTNGSAVTHPHETWNFTLLRWNSLRIPLSRPWRWTRSATRLAISFLLFITVVLSLNFSVILWWWNCVIETRYPYSRCVFTFLRDNSILSVIYLYDMQLIDASSSWKRLKYTAIITMSSVAVKPKVVLLHRRPIRFSIASDISNVKLSMITSAMLKAKIIRNPILNHFDPERSPGIVVYAS